MKCKIKYCTIICLILANLLASSQIKQYKFEQIDSLQRVQQRPIFVFIHASWCKYCMAMQNIAFKQDVIVNTLNSKYYFLSLDAEEKRSILFKGKNYKYIPNGNSTGVNELAVSLAAIKGGISFPTNCILNAEGKLLTRKAGYLSPKELLAILTNNQNIN